MIDVNTPPWIFDPAHVAEAASLEPVHPHFQRELYALVRQVKPDVVLETGVEKGLSAFYILAALDRNRRGPLYSVDPMADEKIRGPVTPIEGHPRWVHVQERSFDALPQLRSEIPGPDIFVHDSDHSYECQRFEYEFAWAWVRPGGYIITDDAEWGGHGAWRRFLFDHGLEEFEIGHARGARRP